MDKQTAAALIENLIQRSAALTDIENEALAIAAAVLREEAVGVSGAPHTTIQSEQYLGDKTAIDTSCLDLPPADERITLCIDFGTAMSKAAIVDTSSGDEVPRVLDLGVPAMQEQVSMSMLVSSAYVSQDGVIYVGHEAVERSREDALTGPANRIDNMKRFLSEGNVGELISPAFNPTSSPLRAKHVLLAYLAYLTWACSECAAKLGYPRNIRRKYAIPCLTGERQNQVNNLMLDLLGWAQVLADSIGSRFLQGVPLEEILEAIDACEQLDRTCDFVVSDVPEPIAVAASYPSTEAEFKSVFLAIDVGAGTTDFGLFKIAVSASNHTFAGICPGKSLKVVREAGDFLDRALRAYILDRAGIGADHPFYERLNAELGRDIRNLKESLFNDKKVHPTLPDDLPALEIELKDFIETPAVRSFADSIHQTVQGILEEVHHSWLTDNEYIGVLLTGGGARLPMLSDLSDNRLIEAQGKQVRLVEVKDVPSWLEESDPDIAEQYSRLAVALGGARPYAVQLRESSFTAGNVKSMPDFDGYYQQGT